MTDPVISCSALTRWYGHVVGLAEVSLEIPPGITGLLGPNGAGKTTLIRCVTGQLRPSRGEVRVFGVDPFANGRVLARLGYCPDDDGLYETLSARTLVTLLTRAHGFHAGEARRRADAAIESFGLSGAADRPVRTFSKGMRQRVKLAQAVAHGPELLILDEPLTGTDPVVRRDIQEGIRGFAAAGGSVLVSSHVLHEVEALTTRIVVLVGGRLVADGDVRELRDLMEDIPHRILVRCDRPRDLARALFAAVELQGVEIGPEGLEARTRDPAGLYAALPAAVAGTGVTVAEVRPEDVDIQAVFSYLIR